MENKKITAEQIERWEIDSLGEAIGNCLELNDDFLSRYCGEKVAEQLRRLPEKDREFILQSHIGDGYAVSGYWSLPDSAIGLPVGEIEYQFDGDPEEVFDNPDDFHISGNCAYLGMDGACFPVDVAELEREIDEHLSSQHDFPDEFFDAYCETALWSSTDENGQPLDSRYSVADIDPETRAQMRADCRDFWNRYGFLMADDPAYGGHNFWLTRNHHGAGFWDGRYPAEIGKKLTAGAHAYGAFDLLPDGVGHVYGSCFCAGLTGRSCTAHGLRGIDRAVLHGSEAARD